MAGIDRAREAIARTAWQLAYEEYHALDQFALEARDLEGLAAASVLARRATEIGRRFGHRDLIAMAIHTEGLVLIAQGRVPEGMALLDQAMTSVVAGELTDYYTGAVYCNVLEACLQLAD